MYLSSRAAGFYSVNAQQYYFAAGTGKTSLLEGRRGIAIDDDSTNSLSQEGLVQLLSSSLFSLLEDKQTSTGDARRMLRWCNAHLADFSMQEQGHVLSQSGAGKTLMH